MKLIRPIILMLAASLLLCSVSCGRRDEPKSKTYYEYFDTVCYISSYREGESEEDFLAVCSSLEEVMDRYNRLLDIYREYEGVNNLATVNKNAGVAPVKVSPELIELLSYGKYICELTDGEVNIAMGAVLSLWHESREAAERGNAAIPEKGELEAASAHISIDSIEIDGENMTVYINDPKTSVDVGAVGKGYVAEVCARMLEERGISSYVLNFGGNIRVIGEKPDGDGWVTGITDPQDRDGGFATRVTLADTSCVTSGSYQRYFTVGDKSYHHIIDKDTLYPAEYFTSVSVICRDSALADVLSTALFSMPYEDGLALCRRLDGVEAIWIRADGTMLVTDGIETISVNG